MITLLWLMYLKMAIIGTFFGCVLLLIRAGAGKRHADRQQ